MILLIYCVCIVSILIFVFLGTILTVRILRNDFEEIEDSGISKDIESEKKEPKQTENETTKEIRVPLPDNLYMKHPDIIIKAERDFIQHMEEMERKRKSNSMKRP